MNGVYAGTIYHQQVCQFVGNLFRQLVHEEGEEDSSIILLLVACFEVGGSRNTYFVRDRIEWSYRIESLQSEPEGSYERLYRMSERSFGKLCSLLDECLKKDTKMSYVRTKKELISTEIMLHCLLRRLAGGSYLDIRIVVGISEAAFYASIHACIDAILNCVELAYHFPQSSDEIDEAAKNFTAHSANAAVRGCAACVDGYLYAVQTLSATETGNVKSYYSGHYQAYGIHVQAACDHECRFVELCIAAPGGANDIAAFRKSNLSMMAANLPVRKFIIGDNAYVCTEHVITPYSGSLRKEPKKDAYNFYASQLRIKVEQTFGFMTTNWRILKRPLQVKLKHAGKVFLVVARLHNVVINERVEPITGSDIDTMFSTQNGALGYVPSDRTVVDVPGCSMIRDIIVDDLNCRALGRPAYNLQRNTDV